MDSRFQAIVSDILQASEAGNEKRQREQEAHRVAEEFRLNWMRAYPAPIYDDSKKVKLDFSDHRLIEVVAAMKARFWDFHLGHFVGYWKGSPGTQLAENFELASIILRRACSGDKAEITEMLRVSERMLPAMSVAHHDMFSFFETRDRDGLPYTPALSGTELVRIVGGTYDKFRGDVKAGRWKCHEDDAVKNKQQRRWRHQDALTQQAALLKIREKIPEKIWSGSGWKK